MPLGFKGHSNRSQPSLDNSQTHPLAAQAQRGLTGDPASLSIETGGEDKSYDARVAQPQSYSTPQNDGQNYIPTNVLPEAQTRTYQDPADAPSRSQSHRYTTGYPTQPSLAALGDPRFGAVDDQLLGDARRPFITATNLRNQQQSVQPPFIEQKKGKTRAFFGLGSKSSRTQEQATSPLQPPTSHNNITGIGRRISKKTKDSPTDFKSSGLNSSVERLQQQGDWQGNPGHDSHLPSPREGDEDDSGLDPYQIQEQQEQLHSTSYDPRVQGSNRLTRTEQDSTVRLVDEGLIYPQYQQQQLSHSQQQQRSLQQHQHLPQLQAPESLESTQLGEYRQYMLSPAQYQSQQGIGNPGVSSLQYSSHQNPEVISQLSHDSPTEGSEEQRPSSVQSSSHGQPGSSTYAASQQDYPARTTSIPGSRPVGQQSTMPPPPAPAPQVRKSVDVKQTLQGEGRTGPPPGYSQQQISGPNQGPGSGTGNQLPQIPGNSQVQNPNYRGSALQREYGQAGSGEQGRSTPPLSENRELSEMDKLVIKYKKVKGLYFEKQAQVEQLQNTLANQRLSQSRTSLDDNEYAIRFNRLDGAIKEIAFSIRKDWKTIPRWLVPYVNQDAQKVGTKEMTAVGRACISRWINDEVFNKCFHPGLDMELSAELKRIEQNVRFFAPHATNQEEQDALTAKIVQWKLTTVEGLAYILNSPQAHEAKAQFIQIAVTNLIAHLLHHLQTPASQGIEGNATSIIELAVGIASHMQLESRDILITYPLPGDAVMPFMKVEQALPALDNPGQDVSTDVEISSTNSDSKEQAAADAEGGKTEASQKLSKKQEKNKSILTGLGGTGAANSKKMTTAGGGELGDIRGGKDRVDGSGKVRFAGFMGVEVRGRQWLVNCPVWTI